MTVEAPAKINLRLAVGPVRADGYHEVLTVYFAVAICDRLRASAADGLTVEVTGRQAELVPVDEGTSRSGRRGCSPNARASRPARTCGSTSASRSPGAWPAAAPTPPPRSSPATACGT